VVSLNVIVREQRRHHHPLGRTRVNEFLVPQVNPDVVHHLSLQGDKEDEVSGAQISSGNRIATMGLIRGRAWESNAGHFPVDLRGQAGAVDTAPIHAAHSIFDPQPVLGFCSPGAGADWLARLGDRSAGRRWWWWCRTRARRALAASEKEKDCSPKGNRLPLTRKSDAMEFESHGAMVINLGTEASCLSLTEKLGG